MGDTFDSKFGAVVAFGPFASADITTQASNQDLVLAQAGTLVVAPAAGSVVGILLHAVGTITAGAMTARAHKASTEFTQVGYPAPVCDATNVNSSYATVRPGLIRFSAGDTLGISMSANTTLAPTNTVDVYAYLLVVFDPE